MKNYYQENHEDSEKENIQAELRVYVNEDEEIKFMCNWEPSEKQLEEIQRPFNTKATTVRWLNEHKDQAEAKLDMVVKHNIESLKKSMCIRK